MLTSLTSSTRVTKDGQLLLRPFDADARAEALALATLPRSREGYDGRRAPRRGGRRVGRVDRGGEAPEARRGPEEARRGRVQLPRASPEFDPDRAPPRGLPRAAEAQRRSSFDRAAVLASVGDAAQIERALFSDLQSEHVLQRCPP